MVNKLRAERDMNASVKYKEEWAVKKNGYKEKMLKLVAVLGSIVLIGCSRGQQLSNTLSTVTFPKAMSEILLSDLSATVKYVPLESKKECMLSDWVTFYMTDAYIVAVDRAIYLFDRQTGKFLRTLGKKGQGPNEYVSTMGSSFYGAFSSVTADKGDSWIEYDLETSCAEIVRKPDVNSLMRFSANDETNKELSMFMKPLLSTIKLDSSLYAGYLHNMDGKNPYLIIYWQKDVSIVKKIPNYLTFEDNPENIVQYPPSFYQYKGDYYFKENFNDTLFVLTDTGLQPYMLFDLGEASVPYERQDWIEDISTCVLPKVLGETDRSLFFVYGSNVAWVDKETFAVKVAEDGFTDEKVGPFSLLPRYMWGNEMLCVLSPLEVMGAAALPESLQGIQEDDNPIIAIVTVE